MASNSHNPQPRPKRICIIGAGISGLRAAGLLNAAGLDITILEARTRIGGRIHQSTQFSSPVDLGASWIHGTKNNPIVRLAEKAKSTAVACGAVYSICDENGVWMDKGIARRYYEEVWEILEMAMEKSGKEGELIPDDAKMMDFFREEVRERSSQVEKPGEYETLMMQIVEMWGAFMGDECENQGLKNLWLDAGLEGDNLFVASTYKDIVNDLWHQTSEHVVLRLGCEVTKISNNESGGVEVEAADGFWNDNSKTHNKYQETFDGVIVTAPLGWLKRNENAFSPPLPPKISTAIRSLGYGNLEKVFIKFPSAFWDAPVPSSTNSDHGRKPSDSQPPTFPIESLFLRPNYAPTTNPSQHQQEIISFSGLPAPYSQPLIMFFIYGPWGTHITTLIRDLPSPSPSYHRTLDSIFQPYYSKLPNYDPESQDCKPVSYLATDWQCDKFAGFGSFTNLQAGCGDAEAWFEALREGMGAERGVWFAGEHVAPVGGLGTVAGAYWSGEEVARRVGRRCGVMVDV